MNLNYFKPQEFIRNGTEWFPLMDASLLVRLDVLRSFWGSAIHISANPHAVGRRDNSQSYHNVEKWGKVMAVDVFPTKNIPDNFRILAVQCGFTGVGYYPQWKMNDNIGGFHLDIGEERRPLKWKVENGQMTIL